MGCFGAGGGGGGGDGGALPRQCEKKYKDFATTLQWVVLVVVEGVRGGGGGMLCSL